MEQEVGLLCARLECMVRSGTGASRLNVIERQALQAFAALE